ncbi:hypothetical protein DNK44_13935 [Pseudomonas dryadis]|uniref:Uncharacterized protein n=1 Tax=Phytopseudomonas dryadis TaxID=2487520 RepID=A0A4V2KC39_9GAMM|nr:hypothetical protein DNK44_13935 [Pseudomonas dryadis]
MARTCRFNPGAQPLPHTPVSRLLLLASLALGSACSSTAPSTTAVGDDAYQRLMKLAADVDARGDSGTAATLYQRAAEQPGAGFEAWHQLGRARLDSGDAAGAEQAYRKALALQPDNPQGLLGLGTAQLRLGYPERAQPLLGAAAESLRDDARVFNRLGVAEALLGNTAAMQRAFARARLLSPDDLDARSNLALAYALNGQTQAALEEIDGLDREPAAQARQQRNVLLIRVLAGQNGELAKVRLDDTNAAQRQALIAEARRIAAIEDAAERARALGLADER